MSSGRVLPAAHFLRERWVVVNEEEQQQNSLPPPYPLAMVVCDYIHNDPGTGKAFLLGCFSVIQAREFPATHPCLALYVSVTNGRGTVPFKVQLVDVNEERDPIWMVEDEMEFPDPRVEAELYFHLINLNFAEPGEYRFQLFACNEFLMERRILVVKVMQDLVDKEGGDQ